MFLRRKYIGRSLVLTLCLPYRLISSAAQCEIYRFHLCNDTEKQLMEDHGVEPYGSYGGKISEFFCIREKFKRERSSKRANIIKSKNRQKQADF